MPSLLRTDWPTDLQRPEVRGVFVGGCVARGDGSRFRAKAHAHTDDWKGWICFLSPKRLHDRMVVLHELAHVLSGEGHTDKWRRVLLEIGGTLDPVPGLMKSYQKRKRSPRPLRPIYLLTVGKMGVGVKCNRCRWTVHDASANPREPYWLRLRPHWENHVQESHALKV